LPLAVELGIALEGSEEGEASSKPAMVFILDAKSVRPEKPLLSFSLSTAIAHP